MAANRFSALSRNSVGAFQVENVQLELAQNQSNQLRLDLIWMANNGNRLPQLGNFLCCHGFAYTEQPVEILQEFSQNPSIRNPPRDRYFSSDHIF